MNDNVASINHNPCRQTRWHGDVSAYGTPPRSVDPGAHTASFYRTAS